MLRIPHDMFPLCRSNSQYLHMHFNRGRAGALHVTMLNVIFTRVRRACHIKQICHFRVLQC